MTGAGVEGPLGRYTAKGASEVSRKGRLRRKAGQKLDATATKSKRKAEAEAEAAPGSSVVAAPTLPPAKNMMWTERVEYLLNSKRQPYHRTGKIDPVADRYDERAKELAVNRERMRLEVEEKGYIYVPDGYEEEMERCNRDAFESAYLEVYGCLPPKDD